MIGWLEDHVAAIDALNSNLGLVGRTWLNWRPDGWYVASRHLQGHSPCLCWLRTDGLAPASKYWTYRSHTGDMGPVSLVACYRHMFDFLHCFIGWLEREHEYGPANRMADVLWIMLGALFLGSSDSIQLCRWLVKGCYMCTMWDMCDLGPYADRAWKACDVLVRFSPVGCTSIRIAVTLGYE
jgi:hypothetical protein